MGNNLPKPLVIERICNAPITMVWRALTDITLLKQWMPFFPDFKPEVGFETRFLLGPDESHQYTHICRVLDVIPGKKITYTWYYEGYPGKSHVSYELFAEGKKTKVILTHTITEAFLPNDPAFSQKSFSEGWHYMIHALQKFIEKEVKNDRSK